MLRVGGRGLLRVVHGITVAPAPTSTHGGHLRVFAAAASRSFSSSPFSSAVPWLQQHASITIPAGDEGDSHDDFKPVQKQSASVPSVYEAIEKDVKENPVMVYMKGVPQAPQCGFSAMVVRILEEHGVEFKSRNVLADPELRTAIKEYSKWPTIPQVYINGELVGGSDILKSMHMSGKLEEVLIKLKEAGR